MPGLDFAHVQDDVNPRIFLHARMHFSLGAAHGMAWPEHKSLHYLGNPLTVFHNFGDVSATSFRHYGRDVRKRTF